MATKPLFGDPTKAPVWSKAAVLLGSLTATTPVGSAAFTLNDPDAGTPVTTQWDPVGLLSDDAPLDDGEESIDMTPHSAFGFGTYAKTYKNQEERITFTALETTLRTLGMLYDATDLTETGSTISGTLKQRDPASKFKLALHRENGTEMERRISNTYAYMDTITRNFGDGASSYTVTAFVVPSSDNELWDYYKGPLV